MSVFVTVLKQKVSQSGLGSHRPHGTRAGLNGLGTCVHNVMVFSTYVMRWIFSTFFKLNVSKSESVLFVFQLSSLENTSLEISLSFQVRKWNSSAVMNYGSRGRKACIILSLWLFC